MKKIFVLLFIGLSLFAKTDPKYLDPVYMIDTKKYPKFGAKIILANGQEVYFATTKSMFDFYFRPRNYPEYNISKESDFKKLLVKDYISGKYIDAKKALYVFGSRLVSPKGDDLIPFKNKDTLNLFMLKYGGTKVLDFNGIKRRGMGLIKYLDMP